MGAKRVDWSIWRYVSSVVHDDIIALRQQIYNELNEKNLYTSTTQLQKQQTYKNKQKLYNTAETLQHC